MVTNFELLPICVCRKVLKSRVRPAGVNRKLGIDDKAFVLVDSVLLTGLGRIALMPALVLAAKVCPEVEQSPLTRLCALPLTAFTVSASP